jgi:hypothetical protein
MEMFFIKNKKSASVLYDELLKNQDNGIYHCCLTFAAYESCDGKD